MTLRIKGAAFSALVAATLGAFVGAGPAAAQEGLVRLSHRGVELAAVPPAPAVAYDTTLVGAEEGLDRLKGALELLLSRSAFSAAALALLRQNGNVILVYDPRFPDPRATAATVQVAGFFPDFFRKDGDGRSGRDFLAVVGRHGIKWPPAELAGVIVHELVGHGVQHLRGRLEYVRGLDLECEAMLYQEKYYQDLAFDKKSREMVRFRRSLEDHWCADFKGFMRKRDPASTALWDVRDPNVERLLAVFQDYVKELADRGVAGDAVAAAKRLREAELDAQVRRPALQGSAKAQNDLGVRYRDGLGLAQDHGEAAKWFRQAADQGHGAAQFNLGALYWEGLGVPQDYGEAARWLRQAAGQGHAQAQHNLAVLYSTGRGVAADDREAALWYRKAADQGYAWSQYTLGTLHRTGKGVTKDARESYFWLTVAARQDPSQVREQAIGLRGRVAAELTAPQIAEVEERARAWRPRAGAP